MYSIISIFKLKTHPKQDVKRLFIMKKPSLEEVQEYFKDAETIKSNIRGNIVKNNGMFRKGYLDNYFYLDSGLGIEVWSKEKGYAKILTYKDPKEETFVITKEQIYNLCGRNIVMDELMREWFPKAFEEDKKELVAGKWYFVERPKSQFYDKQKALIFYEDKDNIYGFTHGGWWTNYYGNPKSDNYIFTEATEQEVFEALKKWGVKRGYDKENTCVKSLIFKEDIINLSNSGYEQTAYKFLENRLLYNGVTIFKDGTWSEIIPTISLKEAEERLNCKIV